MQQREMKKIGNPPDQTCNSDKPRVIEAAEQRANHTIVLDFNCRAIIGVHDFERINHQKLTITLEFTLRENQSPSPELIANINDSITHSINNNNPRLLEKMAYGLANTLLNSFPIMESVSLTIRKPAALTHATCAYVTVSMRNGNK